MKPDPRINAAARLYNTMLKSLRNEGDLALCAALDLLAAGTGENRFRHASSIVRGVVLGPKPIDDAEALRRVAAFPPARRREAVGIVAQQIAGVGASLKQVDTIAHRLRRKLRQNETDRPIMSVASIA